MSLNGSNPQNGHKTVSNEDNDPNARNPMLYDPLQEGQIRTTKRMQYLATIVVCLGAISAGTALAWTSPVGVQIEIPKAADPATGNDVGGTVPFVENSTTTGGLNASINATAAGVVTNVTDNIPKDGLWITSEESSWVGSLLALGAIIGAVPSGVIADKIGRKYTAIIMDIPFIVSWLILSTANSVTMLYLGRFIIGISTGAFCVIAPMYISEIAETSIRGMLGTCFQLFLTIGILFTYLLGALVPWRTLSAVCLIFPITFFVAMFFLPETPTYLLKQGRRGDAALSLKWLWGKYCDSRSAIQAIQNDLDSTGGDASIWDLFTVRSNRKGLIISLALMFFQQFCGINAVIFYSAGIFSSAGTSMSSDVCAIVVGVVQVVMTFVSTLLIERAGRKMLLLISSTVMATCLAVLGIYFSLKDSGSSIVPSIGIVPLLSVVLFIVFFSIGFGPIPWLMMGELFTSDVKGVAVSLTVIFNWTSVFIVTKMFGVIKDSLGASYPFYLFAALTFGGLLFILFVVFETKGKSSAQIQMQLAGEKA